MLCFLSLRLHRSLTRTQLSGVAGEIFRAFFADLITPEGPNTSTYPAATAQLHSFDLASSNQNVAIAPSDDDVWIFGYGSLVWKADFPYIDRRRGFVWGFKRRFYQHSIDHRGMPDKPGRVVTLLPGDPAEDRVYGVAYRIAAAQKDAVLNHLDYREKNGYERCSLEFHEYLSATNPIQVIMYVATQANDSYAGDVWQVPCIARQIFTSAGPSGPNRDYLFNLALAMEKLFPGAVDEHLTELVTCVRRHIEQDEPELLQRALQEEITNILCESVREAVREDEPLDHGETSRRLEALHQNCQKSGWREPLLDVQLRRQSLSTPS
ncbi:GL13138 [Drosophila persimilis]|uniref:glutathione-specific gamma-glutamylcyclotransferase n=1 Tax=Drosophila persimilis TaxID=7234 RepID=B4HBI3_DROPE|nr:putative glutathione-specific gamma-glutamylcyclotransferase 2 [Drosophila persimilis]EDW38754.1 GL13138 [Drosophila persimilis]